MPSDTPTPLAALREKWEREATELALFEAHGHSSPRILAQLAEARVIASALADSERLERERSINEEHRDGFKRIREFLWESPPDVDRAILWCSDSLSGYTDETLAARTAPMPRGDTDIYACRLANAEEIREAEASGNTCTWVRSAQHRWAWTPSCHGVLMSHREVPVGCYYCGGRVTEEVSDAAR